MKDRINFNDMPEFVGDIENILLENNVCDNGEVITNDELEELAQTYDSVGDFLNDLENLYMRTLFDKFEDFLKDKFGEKTTIDYCLNCRATWLTMITPKYGKNIEFESKDDFQKFCEIAKTDALTEEILNDHNDYQKAIEALEILTINGKDVDDIDDIDEDNIQSIFAWLRDSYNENPELFEPQNPYAEAIKARLDYAFSKFNEDKSSQSFIAIQKLQNFILNSLSLEYKITNDYGVLTDEIREFIEKTTAQGKAIVKLDCNFRINDELLDKLDEIDNGEYLDFEIKNTKRKQ